MSTGKLVVQNKKLIKKISNSEAKVGNQLRGIADSSVAAYYLSDIKDKDNLNAFLVEGVNRVIAKNDKMKSYITMVEKFLPYFEIFFKNGFAIFNSAKNSFKASDINLSNLTLDIRGERVFFFFKNKTDDDENFVKLILGDITNIVFERSEDTINVYLELVDDYREKILSKKTKVSEDDLVKCLNVYFNKLAPNFELVLQNFGFDFYSILKNNKFDFVSIINKSLNKGYNVSVKNIRYGMLQAEYYAKRVEYRDIRTDNIIEIDDDDNKKHINNSCPSAYSLEFLVKKIKEYYENILPKPTGIHLFGIDFMDVFEENPNLKKEVIRAAELSDTYLTELRKGIYIGRELKKEKMK